MPYVDFPKTHYMPVVADAMYLDGYKLRLRFDNGEERTIDLEGKLDGGVFEPLKDKSFFQRFWINEWTVEWPNGADIAPETLFEESVPV